VYGRTTSIWTRPYHKTQLRNVSKNAMGTMMRGSGHASCLTPLAMFTSPHPACHLLSAPGKLRWQRAQAFQTAQWTHRRAEVCLRPLQAQSMGSRRRGGLIVEAALPGGNGHASNGLSPRALPAFYHLQMEIVSWVVGSLCTCLSSIMCIAERDVDDLPPGLASSLRNVERLDVLLLNHRSHSDA
jgi:hypothetical protein